MSYKYRYLQSLLSERPNHAKVILITGPRRSGKSTLARRLLDSWGGGAVIQFDTQADQARLAEDPEGFLRSVGKPAVLDEVQNVPQIFNYLKKIVDESPESGCDYILAGSQQCHIRH
jgi:uncharacterized protein